jgi:hypothetical protein
MTSCKIIVDYFYQVYYTVYVGKGNKDERTKYGTLDGTSG